MKRHACTLIALATLMTGCQGNGEEASPGAMHGTVAVQADDLHFRAPEGWRAETPSSEARKLQYALPGATADVDASLILYYFGPGGAGTLRANLDRWVGQFANDAGEPPVEDAIFDERTIDGVDVHTVDVSGRYVAETSPGSGERYDLPDHHMFAAVIDAPAGRYYFKAYGPRATMQRHAAALHAFLESMTVRPTGKTATGPGHP